LDTSTLSPVSPPAEAIRSLFWLVLGIAFGILFIVEAVLIYCILRFRRTRQSGSNEPPQVYGSTPIEIAWTVAPALVVFLLILVIARTEYEVRVNPDRPPANAQPLRVTVVGRQWWWEYRYESFGDRKLGFVTANELHVPAGSLVVPRPVYLTLESADVSHSFWVPRLAGKTDVIPGRVNQMWFQTDRPGTYAGQCAEYCGTQHAGMLLRVDVEPVEQFERWLKEQSEPAAAPGQDDMKAAKGRDVFLSLSCINCHTVRGTPARGTYAPDLTHVMSRQTLASGVIKNTPENLRAWVDNPQRIKPGCLMPAFGLSDEQLDLVVAYLRTLK
jgi:cytochrome c oxidase subunit 2